MSTPPTVYRPLPGRTRGPQGLFQPAIQRLWLGSDHLLIVTTVYWTESYKRFYFNDIQAIAIARTNSGAVMNAVLAGFTLLFALLAAASGSAGTDDGVAGAVALGIVAAVFAIMLLVNAVLGPTCKCQLWTAVNKEDLRCLGRLRNAQRVVGLMRQLIAQEQGELREGSILQAPSTKADAAARDREGIRIGGPHVPEEAARADSGRLHGLFFAVILLNLPLSAATIVDPNLIHPAFELILTLFAVFIGIAAVIRQHRSTLPGQLRTVTWFGVIYVLAFTMVGTYLNAIRDASTMQADEVAQVFVQFQAAADRVLSFLCIGFDAAISVLGFARLRNYWLQMNRRVSGVASESPTDSVTKGL